MRSTAIKKKVMTMEMSNIIIACISLIGTFIGSYSGIRLMSYRIEQLEKRVGEHNNLVTRMYKAEERLEVHEEKISVANHRIDDLEKIVKE
jgi:hypothetical protein